MTKEFTIKYLQRIGIRPFGPRNDVASFIRLHEAHVLNVPFENLNIHNGIKISLKKEHLLEKVIINRRGGFCYELNYLFHLLLIELGFNSKIISAQILGSDLKLGPRFDHMALLVDFGNIQYVADVGYGDLFIAPLRLQTNDIQNDMHHRFMLEEDRNHSCIKLIKLDKESESQPVHVYNFDLQEHSINDFLEQCYWKQTHPASYFVNNKICTLPNKLGRKTIFNEKFIQKTGENKMVEIVKNEKREKQILKSYFDIIE